MKSNDKPNCTPPRSNFALNALATMCVFHARLTMKSAIMLNREMASTRFLKRAWHYWYAAAMSTNPRTIQSFLDVAFIFERLAHDFARFEGQIDGSSQHPSATKRVRYLISDTLAARPL